MQWILFAFLLTTLLSKVPYDYYAPQSVEAFKLFVSALRNETMEYLGCHYHSFNRFLEIERVKWSEQKGKK